MRNSLYWDGFLKRENETLKAIKKNKLPPIRRVAIYSTNKCNFSCAYCKQSRGCNEISKENFDKIVSSHRDNAILHITGGEPSCIKWLYDYIDNTVAKYHLNTNAYLRPPKNVKRLKVSLDTNNEEYFNTLVKKNAFKNVIKNIKYATEYTVTSITCTMTAENYKNLPEFMKFCRTTFPNLYAVFFSIYKGTDSRFVFKSKQADDFFKSIVPKLMDEMDDESLALFKETIDEKRRIMQGVRFPENLVGSKCYLSMSERIYDWNGDEFTCSHLFRDNIFKKDNLIESRCRYGCNRRLVKFNNDVEEKA